MRGLGADWVRNSTSHSRDVACGGERGGAGTEGGAAAPESVRARSVVAVPDSHSSDDRVQIEGGRKEAAERRLRHRTSHPPHGTAHPGGAAQREAAKEACEGFHGFQVCEGFHGGT